MNIRQNDDTPITNFTLSELFGLAGVDNRKGLMRECIVAGGNSSGMKAFRFPCRLDAFIIGVGIEGETRISSNLREFRLRKNSLFVFEPNNILQVHTDEPFECQVLAVTPDIMRRINIDTKHIMPLLLQFSGHPCIEISEAQSLALRSFISLIDQENKGSETPFTHEIVTELISATLYKVGDLLHHYLAEHPDLESPARSRAETYFREFMQLLGEHYTKERSVGFYAQQLCITPKYLTTLVKRISGKSLSEWIDNYVILEAKTLLKYSKMSVQEIAYYLNFPNQSFFGSYFKRNTGMSPSQYKAAQ